MAEFLGPSRTRLPDESHVDFSKPEEVRAYIASLNAALTNALAQRQRRDAATPNVLMLSPNGSAFRVSVDDAGAITAVKLKDPP